MAHDVFISHSSKDKPTADAVCAVLESKSIRCWIAPRDILPGADWGESIIEGIRGSRVMVLVFSKNANESVQIKREVERAIHHGCAIIPLRIEDILPTGALEFSISTAHWLDAFTPPLEKHLNYLAQTVDSILKGKPRPLPEPIPKPGRPAWVNAAIGGGIAAVALILYLTLPMLFPSTVKGTWTLSQCQLTNLPNNSISDLMTAALTGSNLTGKLEVKSLNEYTASITATDSGTVTQVGNVTQISGNDSGKLTFTSNSTKKALNIDYMFEDTGGNGAWAAFGVPNGDTMLIFGVNTGAGEALVHKPAGDNAGAGGAIEGKLVGTWSGTPFNLNPPNTMWNGTLELHADGTYVITVTHNENGILDAANGNWSAKPASGGGLNNMPGNGLFNTSPFSSAHYSFSGSSTLNLGTDNGNFTYKRGW